MRKKEFQLADQEDITSMVYTPGQRIIVEVGVGNKIDGKFVAAGSQNYEQYQLDMTTGLDRFEANAEIMAMVTTFKNFCWDYVVDPIRQDVESKRNAEVVADTNTK